MDGGQTSDLAGLGISKQAVEALAKGGITTRQQLADRREELGKIPGIGEATLKAIHAFLGPPPAANDQPPPAAQPQPGLGAGDPGDPELEQRPRQGVMVVCPYHQEQCTANKTEAFFTRYYCPVKGCNFSQKVPRPDIQARARRLHGVREDYSAR